MLTAEKTTRKSEVPFNPDGSVQHLGVKQGQLSNRLITVGQAERAIFLAESLLTNVSIIISPRHFTVCTGEYKGTQISIVAIGMGYPNMDLFVREARAVLSNVPIYIVRLGTCGSFDDEAAPIASVTTPSQGVIQISENFGSGYTIYPRYFPDSELTERIINNSLGLKVHQTKHSSTDLFYFSQGKYSADFDDSANTGLIHKLTAPEMGIQTIDMETWYLFYLTSKCITPNAGIRAAAVVIPNANRIQGKFLVDSKQKAMCELNAGRICLEALISV